MKLFSSRFCRSDILYDVQPSSTTYPWLPHKLDNMCSSALSDLEGNCFVFVVVDDPCPMFSILRFV